MLGPPPVKVGFFIINRTSFYFVSFFYIKIIPVGRTAGGVLHKIFRGKERKKKTSLEGTQISMERKRETKFSESKETKPSGKRKQWL
jgi:hypothetical protein